MLINAKPRDLFNQENNQTLKIIKIMKYVFFLTEKTQCFSRANTAYREQSYILVYIQHIKEWKHFHTTVY